MQENNKFQHYKNGNRSHYKFLQINGSNADFTTKLEELKEMVNTNKSEIILISESNAETNDKKKMDLRNKEFPNYKFEDKLVTGNEKARSTIMIHNSIDHIRFKKFEDPLNSTTCIKIKDGSKKIWLKGTLFSHPGGAKVQYSGG